MKDKIREEISNEVQRILDMRLGMPTVAISDYILSKECKDLLKQYEEGM